MRFAGLVRPSADAEEFDRDEWIELVEQHDALGTAPPRTGTNPFTGNPYEFHPSPTSARVMFEDNAVGSISWSDDGSGELLVMATEHASAFVESVARDVADQLEGVLVLAADLKVSEE